MHKSKGDDAIKAVGKSKSGMMSLFDEEFYWIKWTWIELNVSSFNINICEL